jgi:hypothetical protein
VMTSCGQYRQDPARTQHTHEGVAAAVLHNVVS